MSGPFTGGRNLMLGSAATGLVCVGLTGLGVALDARAAFSSWLLAFVYWAGLSMASLIVVAVFNAAGARWFTLLRRQLELHGAALLVCFPAFAVVVLGLHHLYPWASRDGLGRLNEHQQAWLAAPVFVARGLGCLAVFLAAWLLFDGSSRAQEARAPDDALRARTRALSSAALPLLALAMFTAAVDWLMSLDPQRSSVVFGLYWLAGASVSALSLLLLVAIVPHDASLCSAKTRSGHVANLAAAMFALSCAWAWFGWPLYVARPRSTAWLAVTVLLVVGRFVLPGLTLLSFQLKRNRKFLTAMAVWILAMEFVDLFWIIMPEAALSWTDFTAWLGLGSLCMAFVISRMRGRPAVPLNDPALEESVRYRQPFA